MPLFDQHGNSMGHQKDAHGGVVISRLNEGILNSLAEGAGGRYIRATYGNDDIFTFIKAVQAFEKEELGEQKLSHYEDQYHYFLLVSFICFAIEWLL